MSEQLTEGDLVNKTSVLTPKYLLPSQWIPVLRALTYSLPLRSLIPVHITPKGWHRTYTMCDVPISRSARPSFAPSWKSLQNRCSCVWLEALFGIVFVPAQGLYGKIWTYPYQLTFLMAFLIASSEHILIWCSCGTKAIIFELSRGTAN